MTMATPERIGQKFNREWIASKDEAKTNYAAAAAGIPDALVAAKSTMLTNYAAALNGGKLERGIAPYRNNTLLSDLFSQSLDLITTLAPAKINKVSNDVRLKRYLGGLIPDIITALKAATSGNVTVPTGLTDDALAPLIVQAINKNQGELSQTSTAAQVLTAISTDLTTLGFPNKA